MQKDKNIIQIKYMINNIVLLILFITSLMLLIQNYSTTVTRNTYLLNIILYLLVTLSLIGITSNAVNYLDIDLNNISLLVIFIITLFSISLINSNNLIVNHLALLLFIIMIGLSLSIYSTANNITTSIIITSFIVILFSIIGYNLPTEYQNEILKILPYLNMILLMFIIISLIMLFTNRTSNKYLDVSIIILFILYILVDSIIINNQVSNNLYENMKHNEINYPNKIIGMVLNFINILGRIINIRR